MHEKFCRETLPTGRRCQAICVVVLTKCVTKILMPQQVRCKQRVLPRPCLSTWVALGRLPGLRSLPWLALALPPPASLPAEAWHSPTA